MIEFVLTGETPAKKNSRITLRNGRTIPSKRYTEWHKLASSQIFSQSIKQVKNPLECPVKIKIAFTHGDKRRRDSDNGVSSILDLLTDCKVLSDDKWEIVRQLEVQNEYEKNNAQCKITIERLNKTDC